MQKCFGVRERYRFQQDMVVAGAQRSILGVEQDFKISLGRGGSVVIEFDAWGVRQFFGRFLADIDAQGGA